MELYSEHYRCAERNDLIVSRHSIDLGIVRVGESLRHRVADGVLTKVGYAQCPTLLDFPGITFSDDGELSGVIAFDPCRNDSYEVEFVAVSTADWDTDGIGLVRIETRFTVEGNEPPAGFDKTAVEASQHEARRAAHQILDSLCDAWERWERNELSNRDTCDQMGAQLRHLRSILEAHPRLDGGLWWAQLGGFHMNVHKLLENALFACELYRG